MKKEEKKKNVILKIDQDLRERSTVSKAYLGCDTCKLKKVKSINKLSDCGVQEKIKLKSLLFDKDERETKNHFVTFTDLRDEDRRRIIELIEQFSKLAENNLRLKEAFDQVQKKRHEQKFFHMKQSKFHLEEKNLYMKQINEFKSKIEKVENDTKNKISELEQQGKLKDDEIARLSKELQQSLKEKNKLLEQMGHLKTCLKHSLESFQRLRAEVTELQREEVSKQFATVSSQTDDNTIGLKEKQKPIDEEDTEEFFSTNNQNSIKARSSLDIINDKLEYVYQMLRRNGDYLPNMNIQKPDGELPTIPENENLENENMLSNNEEATTGSPSLDDLKSGSKENECKLEKPFKECSKTSMQAERILKKIWKPLNLIVNEQTKNLDNKISNFQPKESVRDSNNYLRFLQNEVIQKNNLFKSSEDHEYDEDRLLADLFYSDQGIYFALESILKPEIKEKKSFYKHHFIR